MTTILSFFGFAGICFLIYKAFKMLETRDAKTNQKSIDKNIEWQLMNGLESLTIATLATHSDKSRIASIVSARISDYLKMGVDPGMLYRVFGNLKLNPVIRENWCEKEVELSALIQQYVLQNQNQNDLKLWNRTVLEDKKTGFGQIQNSFLVKVSKNPWTWSPLDN